ncbi:hypothetical protein LCM10_11820 [Rossellomorea aquimaris]|uniref:hypothetical protein n=1 Tax=Rossellomorea aquimaris TaxID=189382 RepID=UPI001CD1CA6C|nr:hypothetical protein [Rossellomorea aquimaris]MCA1055674.1 hypothetical protein [Rossellomorea aquimaris]
MTLSLLFLLLVAIFIAMIRKNGRLYQIKWIHSMSNHSWYSSPWLVGLFLFAVNVVLFGVTGLVLFGLSLLMIPFLHLFIMLGAVIISILVWMSIATSRSWKKWDRLKIGFVGSSFYLILTIFFFYQWASVEPRFPGDDTFMTALGFMVVAVVTAVAFVTCFSMLFFTKRE